MFMKETIVARAALLIAAAFLAAPCHAQSDPASDDEARIADIVTASHILANEGILDSFGHISARSAKNPDHFLCRAPWRPRSSPVTTSSRSDSLRTHRSRCAAAERERYIHCKSTRPAATSSP